VQAQWLMAIWYKNYQSHELTLPGDTLAYNDKKRITNLFKMKRFVKSQRKIRPNGTRSANSAKQKDTQVDIVTVWKTRTRARDLDSNIL